MLKNVFNLYTSTVVNYPKWVLAFIGCLTLVLAAGLPNFKLDASSESLTLENDQDLDFYREVSKDYQSGDFLVVTYTPYEDLFSDHALKVLADLKADLAAIPGVTNVNSILDVPLLYSPKQSIAEIIRSPRNLQTPGVDRALAKQEFQQSPIYKELMLGPNGQTTALQLVIGMDRELVDLALKRDDLRKLEARGELSTAQQAELLEVESVFTARHQATQKLNHERVENVRAVVAKYQAEAEIFVGGVTMITADMITFIEHDLIVFGSAALLFMILVLAVIFRSVKFVVIPMVCCFVAVVMMLGMVSWLDWSLTVISSNFVALLLIISLAIIIHLIVRYREYELEQPHWDQKQLVTATVKFMARPCFYTAITTIVAFASLVISGIRPVIDFGWLMAIGLVVALVLAFLIMPATLMLIPREKVLGADASDEDRNEGTIAPSSKPPFTHYFSTWVEKRGALVLLGTALVAVLSGMGIARLDVENRIIDYFHSSTEIYQGLSVIDENLGGTTSLEIVIRQPKPLQLKSQAPAEVLVQTIDASEEDEFFIEEDDPFADEEEFTEDDPFASDEDAFAEDEPFAEDDPFEDENFAAQTTAPAKGSYWMTPGGMAQIEVLHDYLESLPEIGKVDSLATLNKVGKDLNGSLNSFELSFIERSMGGVIRDVLISPYLSPDGLQTRVVLRIHDLYPDLKRKELADRIEAHIYESGMFAKEDVTFTGLLVLYNNMLQSLFDSQIKTLGLVFACILLMFVVLFRSLPLAVIALLPNMLASLSILGFMGLIGLPLDMMTITIAGVTLGIGVDDTIHYIHRFKQEIQVDGNYIAAMHRSHDSIGRAMLYTSVIIIFGFSIMVMSEFMPTIYFGLLTGLAMLAALMASLLLLPKLILMVKPFQIHSVAKQ